MTERERRVRYIVHHLIAHPLLVVWPEGGAWLHDVSEPADPFEATSSYYADEIRVGDVVLIDRKLRHVVEVWAPYGFNDVVLTCSDGSKWSFRPDEPVAVQARKVEA